MKRTKLLSLISTISTVGVIVPIVTSVTSCSNIALNDDDKEFLNNINTIIAPLDFEGVPFKAVHAVKNAGYNLFEYKFSNPEFELVLNMDEKKYEILYNDTLLINNSKTTNFNKNRVWKFVNEYDPKSEYAQHLNDNFKWDSNKTLEVTGCLDTGTNTNVKKIKYVGTSSQKTCYLRTYTEFLTIEPKAQDTIHHYHYANNVFVKGNGDSHYIEYGRSCYNQAKNTQISFALTKAEDEPCAIDVFEPIDTNVTIVAQNEHANVYSKAGHNSTKGISSPTYKYGELDVVEVQNISELQAINKKCLVRLTNNIEVGEEITTHWTIGDSTNTINVVLDLNGNSIVTPNNATHTSLINIVNGTLILLDSNGPESNATIKGSQNIEVESIENKKAAFILDGGKIELNNNLEDIKRPAINVVSNDDTCQSQFYMYGGSVKANKLHSSDLTASYAIKTKGKGSYSYYVFGDVYGQNGAIIAQDQSEVEVFGGTFASNDSNICIQLNNNCQFTVYGGSFEGGTTIGNVNSKLILNGGLFKAKGTHSETISETLTVDGSVIACYWANSGEKTQPNIISNNVKMYSDKGNILHLGSDSALDVPTTKNWMEFISGCYYFNGSVHKSECNAGMLYDVTTFDKFEWLQKGLWNNIPLN